MTNNSTVRDYLNGLVWDRKPRLRTWIHDFCGAKWCDNSHFGGHLIIENMVRRALFPGCAISGITVLFGKSGIGKSMSLMTLAGDDLYNPILNRPDNHYPPETGKWLVEVPEFSSASFRRNDDIMEYLLKSSDEYRIPYTKDKKTALRSFLPVGTSVERRYIRGTQNDKRIVFVECGITMDRCDIQGIRENRDQLFAEAKAYLDFSWR